MSGYTSVGAVCSFHALYVREFIFKVITGSSDRASWWERKCGKENVALYKSREKCVVKAVELCCCLGKFSLLGNV